MNLVQTKQIQGLEGRLTALETGTVTTAELVGITGDTYQIASGNFTFSGNKTFNGNITIDSPQGLGVQGGSLYVYGYGFIASGLNVGGAINDPRINTPNPRGLLEITGGNAYIGNGGLNIEHGDLSVSGNSYVTGHVSGSDDGYFERLFVTGSNGEFMQLTGGGGGGGGSSFSCPDLSSCNVVYSTGTQHIHELNVSGSLNVTGTVSGSGDAYFTRAYVTGADGNWIQLSGIGGGGGGSSFNCSDLANCNVCIYYRRPIY